MEIVISTSFKLTYNIDKYNLLDYYNDELNGAVPAVYKHKNMQKAKCLSILYVNLNDRDVIVSKGQLVGHGSMCSEKKSSKPVVNVVKPDTIDPPVTEKLWNDLKLEDNEIL